jgi:hypothetical protein
MNEMDPASTSFPLFEVTLHLQEPDIVFVPSLNEDDPEGFLHLIDSLLNDIKLMSVLVQRVAKHLSQPNYKVVMMFLPNVFIVSPVT